MNGTFFECLPSFDRRIINCIFKHHKKLNDDEDIQMYTLKLTSFENEWYKEEKLITYAPFVQQMFFSASDFDYKSLQKMALTKKDTIWNNTFLKPRNLDRNIIDDMNKSKYMLDFSPLSAYIITTVHAL